MAHLALKVAAPSAAAPNADTLTSAAMASAKAVTRYLREIDCTVSSEYSFLENEAAHGRNLMGNAHRPASKVWLRRARANDNDIHRFRLLFRVSGEAESPIEPPHYGDGKAEVPKQRSNS